MASVCRVQRPPASNTGRRSRPALLAGSYLPRPVRRVDIPKPQGGVRTLGIPTLVDRLIQQALHQVLHRSSSRLLGVELRLSTGKQRASSGARRPGSMSPKAGGWVVDMDLEKFFDRVNHDLLMAELAKKIGDERVLDSSAGICEAGHDGGRDRAAEDGRHAARRAAVAAAVEHPADGSGPGTGAPGPCLLPVRGRLQHLRRQPHGGRAGAWRADQRFLAQRLKLTVNPAKSAVARPWKRKFLGYSLTWHKAPRLRIAQASIQRLRERVRRRAAQAREGRSLARTIADLNPVLRGWAAYFRLAEAKACWKSWMGGSGASCAASCGDNGSAPIPGPRI